MSIPRSILGEGCNPLGSQIGRRVDGALEINLLREELAQMTAITTFTVSRLLTSWESQGIVSLRPQSVKVLNLLCLLAITELA